MRTKTVSKGAALVMAFGCIPLTAAFARGDFEVAEGYRKGLNAEFVEGNSEKALTTYTNLLRHASPESVHRENLLAHSRNLKGDKAATVDPAEIAYATGTKTEYYCKGKGLVYAAGQHGDGSWSKLVFIGGVRSTINQSYSQMDGSSQWTYELSDSFRAPIKSQLWMTYGAPNGFDAIEVRNLDNGHTDKGTWESEWDGNDTRSRHSVTGEAVEPIRLFMALQYHLWGSADLGYKLSFAVGAKDTISSKVSGSESEPIRLVAAREVVEQLPEFTYVDASGADHRFADCYKVDLVIKLDDSSAKK